jgi:hypothetical protein
LHTALADALEFTEGAGSKNVQALRSKGSELRLPSLGLLRASRVRLDLLSITYERKLFLRYRYARYILVDSSPQLGTNFLICREDRIGFAREEFCCNVVRSQININDRFSTRICPVSTLGLGNKGVTKLGVNIANLWLMESADLDSFDESRLGFRGWTSDQGTERGIADDGLEIIPQFRGRYDAKSAQSYMYPRMLNVPGHLHILYNALESACKSLPTMEKFTERLKALQRFLCKRPLRRKFVKSCLEAATDDEQQMFMHYSSVHIDWRWEYLSKALDKLIPLLDTLFKFWDESKMLIGETDKSNNSEICDVTKVQGCKHFIEFAEMLRVSGKSIERIAHRLEGCECHKARCYPS